MTAMALSLFLSLHNQHLLIVVIATFRITRSTHNAFCGCPDFLAAQGVRAFVICYPFLALFLQLLVILASERRGFDEEERDEEGQTAAGDHEIVYVADAVS